MLVYAGTYRIGVGIWVEVSISSSRVNGLTHYSYFHSRFHCFDALVVVAGFIVDVLLHGILEEAASLIVILRLWRVFKIIEELSVGASEQTEELEHQVEELKNENGLLRKELERMKALPTK
jgi:voltage-gated hydrogen channel 1